jgi:hypothetical protein
MSGVVPFPPRICKDPDARRVVVAPDMLDPRIWLTWVIGKRGPFVIERTPLRSHAVADGCCYAARFRLRYSEQEHPYDPGPPHRRRSDRGRVYILRQNDGWIVCHDSASGDSSGCSKGYPTFEQAEGVAGYKAIILGAIYERDLPGGAA